LIMNSRNAQASSSKIRALSYNTYSGVRAVPSRKSLFIRSEGSDEGNVKKAFSWLLQNSKTRGFIAVRGYGNLDGVIRNVIGDIAIKALRSQGRLAVSGAEILLITERKLIYNGQNSLLVAFFPSAKFLDQLDSIENVSAMLVVPWSFSEVEPWIKTWNATELGQPERPEQPIVRSRVVEEGLRSLTSRVNVSTGIAHPSDRSAAIQMFEILRNAGETFTPEEVKAWLTAKGGWKATDAQEVAEVAGRILEGRTLRRGSQAWADNILNQWRESARSAS